MPEFLSWTIGVVIFFIALSVSIGLHEGGHMAVARLFKVSVPKFFVGFGKTLWSFKRGGTEYGLKILPLGGFVLIEDESQPEDSMERVLLSHVSPWKRILIFLAGPAVNIVLGVGILIALLVTVSTQAVTTTIDTVDSCATSSKSCEASKAGLLPGDRIVSINGNEVNSISDVDIPAGAAATMVVLRDGSLMDVKISRGPDGKVGITMATVEYTRNFPQAISAVGEVLSQNVQAVATLPSKLVNTVGLVVGSEERTDESLSSIVGVGKIYADTASSTTVSTHSKFVNLATYTGMLNIGLGLINLVPFLPLDGGRIFIAMIDSVRIGWSKVARKKYSPLGYNWVGTLTAVTGVMVFGFMAIAILADIVSPVSIT